MHDVSSDANNWVDAMHHNRRNNFRLCICRHPRNEGPQIDTINSLFLLLEETKRLLQRLLPGKIEV